MFSDKMEDDSTSVGHCVFRGVEYVVTMQVQNGNSLMIEVEDRVTADQWRATLDSTYVEDLTHKTGNFKQFNIFVNMLESALSQTSECVSLDLMTYGDLESLRQRKSGVKSSVPAARTTLNSKRYLILTYTVEFDRIHYPLPLPYVGKPDPRALQETIRQLRKDIKNLKQQGASDFKHKEFEKLQRENKALCREKEELEEAFLQYRRELKQTTEGQAIKEIRILKSVVKNLEEELLREKTKHQKSASKRGKEYRDLLEEVEELRASERNLRVRVKSLTNELAIHRRPVRTGRPASREGSFDRGSSRERSLSYAKEKSLSCDLLNSRGRPRSRGRPSSAPNGSNYSRTSEPRSFTSVRSARSRSPSPNLGNPRFDPTAYVKEKQRRKNEAEKRRQRRSRPGASSSADKRRTSSSPFSSSRYSANNNSNGRRSRNSSGGSQGYLSDGGMSDSSYSKLRIGQRRTSREALRPNHSQNSSYMSSGRALRTNRSSSRDRQQKQHILSSTPESADRRRPVRRNKENQLESESDQEYYDQSAEMSEIDARLNRLQQLMKTTLQ
ncbi:centrosomal protein CCDC61-like isoform X2 [Liolophura sinensis]|uniref:centrosomal protein CCDC61-like isoform X2 n=1 Tax=Liolophura sinensis TaxID=3198878 RepID=UPI00315990C2